MSTMLLPVAGAPYLPQEFVKNNPVWLVAQVMMGLNNAQGDLLNTMKLQVTALTRNLAEVNDVLKKLYVAQESDGMGDKTTKFNIATSEPLKVLPWQADDTPETFEARLALQKEQRNALVKLAQAVVEYGAAQAVPFDDGQLPFMVGDMEINGHYLASPPAEAGMWVYTASATSAKIDSMTQGMQRAVDDVSGRVQQAQLDLQTMMGRYNGAFQVVTSAIKKVETQSQLSIMNFGR
ncbi:MAG: hypothetical protein EOO28_16345 [Comamonadaceae bacterium]|nr:MAG: hypothetical protein EOO28_16345 [Comamonadaceae bacterium]